MNSALQKLPILIGATATGKTKLATQLQSSTCIINADSRQVYKGMDIGTAKPKKDIQDLHSYVGIDLVAPDEQFDVAQFIDLADQTIDAMRMAQQPCIMVGGAGFYVRHFLFGISQMEPVHPLLRKHIREYIAEKGNQHAYDRLRRIDPKSAEKIHVHDTYRIARALEIYEQTGKPRSAFSMYDVTRRTPAHEIVGLYCDPHILAQRIALRVDMMFKNGLVEEVKTLKNKGYSLQHPSMHCIGYKEFFSDNECLNNSHKSGIFDTIKNTIVQKTIQYAKRQQVFFKQFQTAKWYSISETDKLLVHLKRLLD